MARRIRVLHLIDNLDLGGAQTVLFSCLTQASPNYEIVLASLHANRNVLFWERAQALGLRVVALSPYRWLPVYLLTLPWLLWRTRFDVVQCHLFASNWLGKPLARLFGVPLVISHDHSYDDFRFDWPVILALDRWANRFADRIFVISESLLERLRTAENIPESKLIFIRNGVAGHSQRERRIAKERKMIGAAGRLVSWKNFDRFLRIAERLVSIDPRYRFVIAGDGPELEVLQGLARQLAIHDHVIWRGALASLGQFFDEIDLLVLSSDWEDVPIVVLEAFSYRVPVALVGINAERRRLKQAALVLDPTEDEQAWAKQIHALLDSPKQMESLCVEATRLVEKEFSPAQQIRKMEGVYEELLRVDRS
ncbi:MAG TPA: glycosyltransferase family 4 protein [Chthoniobacterales bacterium]|nr:glycosyltransferase family 4 protein [Chthoniobacterales bacterium]